MPRPMKLVDAYSSPLVRQASYLTDGKELMKSAIVYLEVLKERRLRGTLPSWELHLGCNYLDSLGESDVLFLPSAQGQLFA